MWYSLFKHARTVRSFVKTIKMGIAMSGGVDSTSTALMLKDQYTVTGFFMQLAQPDLQQQRKIVTAMADRIGIPLEIIDLSSLFQEKVLDYFCNSYFKGLTPNPCVICNREIKFGSFVDAMLERGMDKIATGHYARVVEKDGIFGLYKGRDTKKDQSYFLSRLSQQQLSKVIFPLGEMGKEDIYRYVEEKGFVHFRGKESQDVCFLENTNVSEYLKQHFTTSPSPGLLKNTKGETLGTHKGIQNFTIGQRRGLGISDTTPYYVVGLDAADNSVIVGKNEDLLSDYIELYEPHWISGTTPDCNKEYQVKIRSTHAGATALLFQPDHGKYSLKFNTPQRAITPGQFAVIYDNDQVMGSGVILNR